MARLGVGIGLVGRQQELAALAAALDRATADRPSGVLLSGDAGVGKSRLVTETVERAEAAGFTVLIGRCLDSAASLPYLPFTEIAARLATLHPELLDAHAELGRLLPGTTLSARLAAEDRELGQLRVFDAVLSALHALSTSGPALLVVEDLHWADRSTRDLLVFLLSRLTAQRLMVLATYRADDMHRRHPLRPVLSELVRLPAVERVDLTPLDAVDALALVRLLADGSLGEAMLQRVARRSEGNAFFAEELVSASSDGLPHGLAEVLMARVEALPPITQQVLRIASVAGRRVRHDRLAEASGLPDDELDQALRDAVAHYVLVAGAAGDDYVFRHALLREAVYHELLPGERSRLHARYAQLLAAQLDAPGAPAPPGTAAELAHHALAGHDIPRALVASVRAAREANDRYAPAEMLLHAERAIDLWTSVPDAESLCSIDEGTLTRWAAWGASATGDPDRGIALARRALELADERGDPELSSTIGRRYALRLLDLGGREQEALDVAQRALDLIAGGPASGDLAWSHAVVARALDRLDRSPEAAAAAQTALDVARAFPHDLHAVGATADALVSLAVSDEKAGRPQRARQRWADAIPLARRSNNLGVELRAHYNAGISLLDEGRSREAGDEFALGEARAAETGITWSGYGLELRVAHVIARFVRGDWDGAERGAELAGESVSATVASRLAAAGLLTAVGRGRLDAAERRMAELRDSQPADDHVIMLLGQAGAETAMWRGRPEDAVARVDEALAGLHVVFPLHLGGIMLAALGIAAQADLAAVGSGPRAGPMGTGKALLEVAEHVAARGQPRAETLGPEGRAWLCRARAELTRLNGRSDPDAWAQVVAAFAYECPSGIRGYRAAYARFRRAEAMLAIGDPHTRRGPIADELRSALATATALGAEPLATVVRSLAARAGVVLDDAGARSVTSVGDPFTPRERSVLALVAGGRTNRQVGAELFISEKTVSVHLSRVMGKLGASSRTEAVSIAYARGLL